MSIFKVRSCRLITESLLGMVVCRETRVLTYAFFYEKLLTVFCLHSVLEHQQQQLDLQETRSSRPGQAVRFTREGGMDRPSQHKSQPAGSLSSSQPDGPPCWVISLAFASLVVYVEETIALISNILNSTSTPTSVTDTHKEMQIMKV
jgi:hypothetical protein